MTTTARPDAVVTTTGRVLGGRKEVWRKVCALCELVPERGSAALVDGVQIALFRLAEVDGVAPTVLAVQNLDPYCGAHVLSRGIVGSRGAAATLASPMYKQVFDLRTGECLETVGREAVTLTCVPVRVRGGVVEVSGPPGAPARLPA